MRTSSPSPMTRKRTRLGEIGRAFKERGGKYEMRINYLRDIEDDAEDIDIPAVCNLYKLDWFLQGVTRGRTKILSVF